MATLPSFQAVLSLAWAHQRFRHGAFLRGTIRCPKLGQSAFFPGSRKAVSGEAERRGGWLPCEEEGPRDHTNSKARERVSNFWFVQSSGLQPPPCPPHPPALILRDLESFLLCYLVAPVRVLSFAFQSTLANTELWNSVFPPSAHNRRHRTSWMGQGSGGGGSDFFLRALPIFLHHK